MDGLVGEPIRIVLRIPDALDEEYRIFKHTRMEVLELQCHLKEMPDYLNNSLSEENSHLRDWRQACSRLQCYGPIEPQVAADFCTGNTRIAADTAGQVDWNTKLLDNLHKEHWRHIKERGDCFDIAMAEEKAHLGDCNRFSSDNYLCGENDMPEVILDNQALVHCTGNFNMLSNLNIGRENVVLIAANGGEMGTFMSGSVHMGNFILPDVRYCPELGNRIIVSGSILDNDDYGYEFARGKFTVKDLKNDTSVGEGHLVDGNYNVTAHMVGSTDTFYSPGYVEFVVEASPKGGSVIKIGSHVIHVPKYLSVHHPLVQMVLFARNKFADTFACCESMAPKSIFDMAKRLHAFALSNWWKTDWNLARPKSGSHPSDTGASGAVWIAATAAPHHATGNRNLLAGFIIEHDDLFVHAVDGVPRKVLAHGAVITDSVVLPDVWFVPGLAENLVSVSQLVDLDHSVGFSSGKCCIRRTDGKVVGKGRLQEGGHYVVDFLKVPLAI